MNLSQTFNDHPSASYRSGYEGSFTPYSRHSSPSPPPSSPPPPTVWSTKIARHHHNDSLHSVLGSPRVTKSVHQKHHYFNQDESSRGIVSDFYNGSTTARSPYSTIKSSSYGAPRSCGRLPSIIDRIKTDLKSPTRSLSPSSPHQHHYGVRYPPRSPSPQSMYSEMADYEDSPLPTPTLFGIPCTEVSQRAYSGQSSQMKKSFERLQRLDSGRVEYRTIAFCTHLTVSRWEPNTSCPPSPTSTAAAAMAAAATTAPASSAEDVNSTSTQPSKNDPVHAARLMSLANYVRHILSLTAGNPNAQSSQIPTKQQPSQPQSYSKQEHVRTHESQSSGPGPIKSDSSRRHRYSPEYHRQFLGRRHQQPEQRPLPSEVSSMTASRTRYDHGYRHEDSSFDHRIEHHRSPSQFHPHSHSHSHSSPQRSHFAHYSQQPNPTSVWVAQTQAATRNLSALIKIPHPNLTLTLALIYVDRLKAKYPEAKGEPGCSHRLFLVAYIIAAKYRCSVELSPHVTRDGSENADGERDDGSSGVAAMQDRDSFDSFEQSLEARLNAELIFSNHAWVRLLNLGLFYRQSTATPSSQASHDSTISPSSSSSSSPASPPVDAAPMTRLQPHAQPQNPSLSSIINPSSAPAAMLQVEDLDRMEAEFLTFLNFDLATMSHDLETCWNLLVGRNEVSSR